MGRMDELSGRAMTPGTGTVPWSHMPSSMIRLDDLAEQNGRRRVAIDASSALRHGGRIGLLRPNRAGKTTPFRMLTGNEQRDEG